MSQIIVQAIHASLFKFVQIKASPDEINTIDVLHGFPQPKPRNLVSIGSRTHHQAWTKALASPPTCRQNSRLLDRIMVTCVALLLWRSCHALPLSSVVHAPKNYVNILLTTSMTSFVDVGKSHASPSHISPSPR